MTLSRGFGAMLAFGLAGLQVPSMMNGDSLSWAAFGVAFSAGVMQMITGYREYV